MNRRAGVSVLLANLGGIDQCRAAGRVLVDAGVGRVWLAETRGPDPLVAAAVLALEHQLEVGCAVVSVSARTPASLALAVADIATLSNGRPVHVGLGAGGQVPVERWHGMPFSAAVERVSDTIAILRQALAGERTSHAGRQRSSVGFRLTSPPDPSQVLIYVGGMGPKMMAMASKVADGVILTWLTPQIVASKAAELRATEKEMDRPARSIRLVSRVYVALTDDVERVRRGVAEELVEYLVSPPYGNYFRSVGFGDEVDAVNAAFAVGDRAASVGAVSPRMLDEMLVAGDVSVIRAAIDRFREAGADDVLVQPVPAHRGGDLAATIAALGDL